MNEPWREALGALRLTLWDDSDDTEEWQLERARDEVEWLCRVLNGIEPNKLIRMRGMGMPREVDR